MQRTIPLHQIVPNANAQLRVSLNQETVDRYAELMADGVEFPPIDVFAESDSGPFLIADGFQRYYATAKNGGDCIACTVHPGNLTDCIKFAITANNNHGEPFKLGDKQKKILVAFSIYEQEIINRSVTFVELARMCGCHQPWVSMLWSEYVGKPRKKKTEPDKEPRNYDELGNEIPERLEASFRKRNKFRELKNLVDKTRRGVEQLVGEPGGEWLSDSILNPILEIRSLLAEAEPYSVCSNCDGDGCECCRLLGYLPKRDQ